METSIDYSTTDIWTTVNDVFSGLELRPAERCGNVRCEPGWEWRLDLVDYDLWLAVDGQGAFLIGDHPYAVKPGTLFLLRPGDEGMATQDPRNPLAVVYTHFSLHRYGSERPVVLDASVMPDRCIPVQDFSRIESWLARVVRLQQQPAPLSAVEARALLLLSMVEAYQQDAVNHGIANVRLDSRLARVLQQMHRHPARRLSLTEAARLANLSPDHFSRLFRTNIGSSFRQYSLNVRLDRARHLLEESTLTVNEIAQSLGYDDVFLFSRQCKARFGYAPSHLRSGMRRGCSLISK